MRKLRDKSKHNFTTASQQHLLNCMISDTDTFTRCRGIVRDEYFDDPLVSTVQFILEYADEFHSLPEPALIRVKTDVDLQTTTGFSLDWFLKEIEEFCRFRSMENTIFDALDLLQEGKTGELERRFKESLTIRLASDLGTDYFDDPAARLRRLLDRSGFVSTGWKTLDAKLYGGFSRGTLNVFCGCSGSGKSLVLQNLALNWVTAGFVVVYFTLELAEDFTSLRIDSMITGLSTTAITHNVDDAAFRIKLAAKRSKANRLIIKKMPEGSTTTNDLRAYLKEFEIQNGIRPDAIIIDYLDLMYPNNQRVDPSDLFVKDKYVAEELRALMDEANAFGATASQLNRSAIAANGEFDHSHIAGGISKINTADNVIAILPNFQRGYYSMMFLKTRSSSAVNDQIKLDYNVNCMRISDPVVDSASETIQDTEVVSAPSITRETATEMMQRSHRKR